MPKLEANYENLTATERATVFYKRVYSVYGFEDRCPIEALGPIMQGNQLSEHLYNAIQTKYGEGSYIKNHEFLEQLVHQLLYGIGLPFLEGEKAKEEDYREAFDYCNSSAQIAVYVQDLYNKIDKDGSGYIEKSELESIVGKHE